MKRIHIFMIGIVGMSISCLLLTSPIPAQMVCGANPPPAPITLSVDNGEVAVTLRTSSGTMVEGPSLVIGSEGISININYKPDGSGFTSVGVSNGPSAFCWEPGMITLRSSSFFSNSKPVDLSPLPPDYANLWKRMMKIVGELIETDEFWKLIGVEKNDPATLAVFQGIRDGHSVPSAFDQSMNLRFGVFPRYEVGELLCRIYTLNGICEMSIATPDPVGEPDPMLYLTFNGKYPDSRWFLTANPDTHKCTFKWGMGDSTKPIEESVWRGKLAKMRDNLLFFRDRIPSMTEKGVIGSYSELGSLIDKSLKVVDNYPVELVYPAPQIAQASGGACPVPLSATIAVPDGDLKVMYIKSGSAQGSPNTITFTGNGMSAQVHFYIEENKDLSLNVSNCEKPYEYGKDFIQLSSSQSSSEKPPEVLDLKALPDNYRDLWDRMRTTIGQVAEKDEFWQLMGGVKNNAQLKSQLELIRDGYTAPTAYQNIFNIESDIREKSDGFQVSSVSRGYTLDGPGHIEIFTSSSFDNPKPVLQARMWENGHSKQWKLDIDPETQTCSISLMGRDMSKEITEDQWKPVVKRMKENLQFFQDQMPLFIEKGIIKPGDELGKFLTLALDGIDKYPVEFVPYVPAIAPMRPN
jgi:hypothetical protein